MIIVEVKDMVESGMMTGIIMGESKVMTIIHLEIIIIMIMISKLYLIILFITYL